jgi:hypothetical protein
MFRELMAPLGSVSGTPRSSCTYHSLKGAGVHTTASINSKLHSFPPSVISVAPATFIFFTDNVLCSLTTDLNRFQSLPSTKNYHLGGHRMIRLSLPSHITWAAAGKLGNLTNLQSEVLSCKVFSTCKDRENIRFLDRQGCILHSKSSGRGTDGADEKCITRHLKGRCHM